MQDSMFNTEMPEVVAPSLASSAMVVSLTRSVPDLMKNDPEAARALAILKKANPAVLRTTTYGSLAGVSISTTLRQLYLGVS